MNLPRIPSICVSIQDNTLKGFIEKISKVKNVDLIEIRADYLKDENDIYELLRNVETKIPTIFTLRSSKEGGFFKKEETLRIKLLKEAIKHVDLIDIELSTQTKYIKDLIKEARNYNTDIIISYHDFSKTPSKKSLKDIIDRERNLGADICKIATKINNTRDIIEMLEVLIEDKDRNLCLLGMGELGKITRIIFPYFGSVIVYGYFDKPTASGQLHYEELIKVFKILNLR